MNNYRNYFQLLALMALCMLPVGNSVAQIEGVTKRSMSIDRRPITAPPSLSMVPGSMRFEDANGNRRLDADEEAMLIFSIENSAQAKGDAEGLECEIRVDGTSNGVIVPLQFPMADIPVGQTVEYSIPITSERNTRDGVLKLNVKVREPQGFSVPEQPFEIMTQAFREPQIAISDWRVREGQIKRGEWFTYEFLLTNSGQGFAYDVRCEMELPDEGVSGDGKVYFKFDRMKPGEQKVLSANIGVSPDYGNGKIRVHLKTSESFGRYAEDFTNDLEIDGQLQTQTWSPEDVVVTEESGGGFFGADVDRHVPKGRKSFRNRCAVVIGNEDYSERNTGLIGTQDVPYAKRDAKIMAQYLESLWGIPEEKVILITNATKGEMQRAINRLSEFAEIRDGDAELIFYYSGHGLPSEGSDEPYLIPVDVDGSRPEDGLALNWVFEKLKEHTSSRVTVFLDACFSGGARDGSLLADTKGIYREPDVVKATGNSVVFASSSGSQSSGVFKEKEHGYFTYFLLKFMMEKEDKLTYGAMFDFIEEEVKNQAFNDGRSQTPNVNPSRELGDEWKNWGIND